MRCSGATAGPGEKGAAGGDGDGNEFGVSDADGGEFSLGLGLGDGEEGKDGKEEGLHAASASLADHH